MEPENVSPARRNASTSNKPAISSPLKRNMIPDEPMSSPHFRPADLLADEEMVQASQTQPNLSQQVKKANRKSLGRRVSFAATAHVRLYEKGDKSEDEASSKEEDMDFRPMKQPHSPIPPVSPMRPHDHENSLPSTPSIVMIPGGRQPSQSPSLLRFSTIGAAGNSSPIVPSSSSIGSFDVDIKDVNSSSFASYVSGGEDDDNVTIELPALHKDEGADMEFTGCVGGILAKADHRRRSLPKEPASEMDMTVCVGGLVSQFPGSLRLLSDSAMSTGSPTSSVDTMELTECVGQILARQNGQLNKPTTGPQERCSSMASINDNNDDNDTMDMTMVVRAPIVQRQLSGSPSPFLVASPTQQKSTPSKTAGMTFIGDIGEPDAFQMLACVSPVAEPPNVSAAEADQQLFQTFIHTERLDDDHAMQVDSKPLNMEEVSHLNSPRTFPTSFAASNNYRQAMMSRETSLDSVYSTGPAPNHNQAMNVSSPMSMPQPSASLSDFLNETGIRFLENISSLKRRETTGRPRDSDVVSPAKQAFIATALVPQLDFYDQVHTTNFYIMLDSCLHRLLMISSQGSCRPRRL